MLCYVLYHACINFIIATQTSQKLYLCRCKYIPIIGIEQCHHCFALLCECVPIDIVMKEGKGELKHFKNLMKEHEMCTIKCVDKICHNDQSCMLI